MISNNFYVYARATLLVGRNHHSAHVGLLTPAAIDYTGCDTRIPFEKATVAEIYRETDTTLVGRDLIAPVSDRYTVPFAFIGKIKKASIDYTKN